MTRSTGSIGPAVRTGRRVAALLLAAAALTACTLPSSAGSASPSPSVTSDLAAVSVSPGPDKPKVAFVNLVPPEKNGFTIGGQKLDASTYSAERGHPRLRARHLPFAIGSSERDAWMACMRAALDAEVADEEARRDIHDAMARLADFMRNRED